MSARTRSSAAAAATSSPSPVTPAASASSVSSPSTATARASSFAVRAERGEPVQDEPAHGRGADVLDLARGGGRRRDPGRVDGVQQLAQEQRVAARRRVTRAAELVRRVGAQALPCQRDRRGLAERPRVQRDGGGARRPPAPTPSRARRPVDVPRAAWRPAAPRCAARGRPGSAASPGRPSGSRRPDTSSGARSARLTTSQYRLWSASKPASSRPSPLLAREQARRGAGGARERIGGSVQGRLEQLAHHAERERLLELGARRLERRSGRRARPPRVPHAPARSCRPRPVPR